MPTAALVKFSPSRILKNLAPAIVHSALILIYVSKHFGTQPQAYGRFKRSHPIGLGMESRGVKFGAPIKSFPVI